MYSRTINTITVCTSPTLRCRLTRVQEKKRERERDSNETTNGDEVHYSRRNIPKIGILSGGDGVS